MSPPPPVPGKTYLIVLCSGEERRWRFLGTGPDGTWWRDLETGRDFNEANLMYAWTIQGALEVPGEAADPAPGALPPV